MRTKKNKNNSKKNKTKKKRGRRGTSAAIQKQDKGAKRFLDTYVQFRIMVLNL